MKDIDLMPVWKFCVALGGTFTLGMLLAFAIVSEDCQMFGKFRSFGGVYECKAKQ